MTSDILPDLKARLALAEKIALEAGATALDYFNRRNTLIIETKNDPQDFVSIADRNVEKLIRDRVDSAYQDDAFLGEEYGLQEGSSGFTWVVDPIDGTSPFVNGIPSWCVSIAVLYNNEPVIGVIAAPCQNEIYVSARGLGATLNGEPLKVDASKTIQNGVTGISANTHVTPQFVAGIIEKLLGCGGTFYRNGSGALMLAYVAAGRLVGFYEGYMHAWDCMAGFCLVKEAGGYYHPFPVDGSNLTKGNQVFAAAPGAIDDLKKIANL